MILDDLPRDPIAGFVELERRLKEKFAFESTGRPSSGQALVQWIAARREYVQWLRTYSVESNLEARFDPPPNGSKEFIENYFPKFQGEVGWWVKRYLIRLADSAPEEKFLVDVVSLREDYRDAIHEHLNRIRKIIHLVSLEERQRQKILDLINVLAAEIDRKKSKLSAFLDMYLEVTRVIGEGADNLEPVVKQLERIGGILGRAKNEKNMETLSSPDSLKQLPRPEKDADKDESDDV